MRVEPPPPAGSQPGDRLPSGADVPPPPPPPMPPARDGSSSEGGAFSAGPAAPPAKRRSLGRLLLIAGAAVAVLAAGVAAFAFFTLRGTSDVLAKMAPVDSDVYVTAYLDPAAGQKVHLFELAKKFPATANAKELSARIDDLLDQVLSEAGLTHADIRPWLGSQVAVVIRMEESTPTQFAVLLKTKDDAATERALAKIRSGPSTGQDTWTDETHGGVKVSVGRLQTGDVDTVYAVVDHTAVLSPSQALVEAIIDADQGAADSLSKSDRFHQTVDSLPRDVLGLAYVDAGRLIDRFIQSSEVDVPLAGSGFDPKSLSGAAIAVKAGSTGIGVNLSVGLDPQKLTAAQRSVLENPAGPVQLTEWVPTDAYGMVDVQSAPSALQEQVDRLSTSADPKTRQQLADLGLTGANGVISKLTGEIALEVGPGAASATPSGALLLGTTDEASMRTFLEKLVTQVADQGDVGAPAGSGWQTEQFGTVTISYLPLEDGPPGFEPAYAISDGVAILGSSRDRVKAVLQAHQQSNGVVETELYKDAAGEADTDSGFLFYVNVERIRSAIRDSLSPEDQSDFDSNVAPNLAHFSSFIVTAKGDRDHQAVRMFLVIR
jgi:hypothetical protein